MVTERCELKGSANLVGSLTTNRLVMDEGASMIGKAEITPNNLNRARGSQTRDRGRSGAAGSADPGDAFDAAVAEFGQAVRVGFRRGIAPGRGLTD